jgi:hypothetical protein
VRHQHIDIDSAINLVYLLPVEHDAPDGGVLVVSLALTQQQAATIWTSGNGKASLLPIIASFLASHNFLRSPPR